MAENNKTKTRCCLLQKTSMGEEGDFEIRKSIAKLYMLENVFISPKDGKERLNDLSDTAYDGFCTIYSEALTGLICVRNDILDAPKEEAS